jgi:hypothetical protein
MYIQLYGFLHSLCIHVHTTIRIPSFTVYTCTYNYTDSLIHCLYMYIQLCGFPLSLSIHVHATIQIPSFTVYICTYNHKDSSFTVCTCACNYTDSPFTVYTCTYSYTDSPIHCLYMYIQLYGFSHSLFIHVYTTMRIVACTCTHSE